jgi:hypothetical protein
MDEKLAFPQFLFGFFYFLVLTQLSLTSRTSNPIFIFSFVTEHLISFSDRREMEFKNTAVQVSFALSRKFPAKSKG